MIQKATLEWNRTTDLLRVKETSSPLDHKSAYYWSRRPESNQWPMDDWYMLYCRYSPPLYQLSYDEELMLLVIENYSITFRWILIWVWVEPSTLDLLDLIRTITNSATKACSDIVYQLKKVTCPCWAVWFAVPCSLSGSKSYSQSAWYINNRR